MGPKRSASKAKDIYVVANDHPEPSVKPSTTKFRKARTSKPELKPKKAVGKDEVPGAELFEHIKKGDLLSVAAPLASRKRAADFFDSDSDDDENDHQQQPIAAPEPKKAKKTLKGFESTDSEDSSGDEGFEQGRPIPKVPNTRKTQNKLARIKENGNTETGVIYVGRIPHGFYEDEMRAYFSQFGEITRLRLSRNRVTGRSKHYAFVEFASSDVAQIVADTMNNYLLFGHILKCRIIPKEQVHEQLWKGANKKFRPIPRNKLEGKLLESPKPREKWTKKVEEETRRRRSKISKLGKSMGYEFELPVLRTVDEAKMAGDEEESEDEAEQQQHLEVEGQEAIADEMVEEKSEPMTAIEAAKETKTKKGQKPQKTQKVERVQRASRKA
ncbi:MAG: hypothetical protein M1816_005859 [Peltula sp. TS41687]|nr:MAG: hypothetical protein M1816_005859 [Peltula sp. TS41687]